MSRVLTNDSKLGKAINWSRAFLQKGIGFVPNRISLIREVLLYLVFLFIIMGSLRCAFVDLGMVPCNVKSWIVPFSFFHLFVALVVLRVVRYP